MYSAKFPPKTHRVFFFCKSREAQQFSMARGKFQRNLRQSGAGRYFHATTKAKLHLQLGNSAPKVWIEICFVDGCNMLHVFQLWNLGHLVQSWDSSLWVPWSKSLQVDDHRIIKETIKNEVNVSSNQTSSLSYLIITTDSWWFRNFLEGCLYNPIISGLHPMKFH